MCCTGCATAAAIIHESGLQAYYKRRTARPRPINESRTLPGNAFIDILDDEAIQSQYARATEDDSVNMSFIVQNMHCPTCVWLIEQRLHSYPGVVEAKVNYRNQKLSLRWRRGQVSASELARCVEELGYGMLPYSPSTFAQTIRAQHQDLLKRLGVAGVFGMQIMVLAVALYASDWSSIASQYEELFRRLSLLLVLPIMLFCAAPIFSGAIRDIRHRSATMDIPIALGLLIAFMASAYATLSGTGEIYFDSIAMFVFLQLVARFFEQGAFRRMNDQIATLAATAPSYANLLESADEAHSSRVIPAIRLNVGDHILIKPGETAPSDCEIVSGQTGIDQSVITGESSQVRCGKGDSICGGSINVTDAVVAKVTARSSESALASIITLLEQSIAEKPASRRLTDLIARHFSITVVLIATCVGSFWLWAGNPQWLAHTISVLVVACPCALSLAVPTALTAAVNASAKHGILLARPGAVDSLAKADTFVFDKTGTLTQAVAHLDRIEMLDPGNQHEAAQIARTLAQFTDHPIAIALRSERSSECHLDTTNVELEPGGVSATVAGTQYFFGSADLMRKHHVDMSQVAMQKHPGLVAYLSDQLKPIARFYFANSLRKDAKQTIERIDRLQKRTALVTGDRESEAKRIASELGIQEVHSKCAPEDKLKIIREHQRNGQCVAMVGDGINDAPTLAAANVSIAPSNAQHIAKAHADVLFLDDRLSLLPTALQIAAFSAAVMRHGTIWAIAYNLIGISFAAAGLVPPVAAAIGMSASSLIVVLNSLRIMSYKAQAA